MDPTQYVLLGAVIVGVTELLKRLRARDWFVAVTILSAAIIGALFGAFKYYPDLDWIEGVAVGFGASGALSALGIIARKSTPAPSAPVDTTKSQ